MADSTTTTANQRFDDYIAFLRRTDDRHNPFRNGNGELASPEYAPMEKPAIALIHAAAAFIEATVDAGFTAAEAGDAIQAIAGPLYRV